MLTPFVDPNLSGGSEVCFVARVGIVVIVDANQQTVVGPVHCVFLVFIGNAGCAAQTAEDTLNCS